MPFISNVEHVTLGDGVYTNVHGNYVVQNIFYGRKRHHGEVGGPNSEVLTLPSSKRCRREDPQPPDGLEIIRRKDLKLTRELSAGPGYLHHAGQTDSRAVIVKVFNAAPTAREQLETTVALSNHLMHPNILRIEGISAPGDLNQFIAYENVHWKNAEGPLAAALKNNVTTSVTLGLKMVAGLSSGINHLDLQGISLASMRPENFDIFLDIGDRFVLSINPSIPSESCIDPRSMSQNDTEPCWNLLNSLCQKLLRSANYVLHNENIDRAPDNVYLLGGSVPRISEPSSTARESGSASDVSENHTVPPRREYVWRTVTRGKQSLSTVATRIGLDLDLKLSSISWLARSDPRNPHRCPGYIREEITLATTTIASAVVSHDTPSASEICSVCREVVGLQEVFRCVCGEPTPGSGHTIKCRVCAAWSHGDCVGNTKDFTCHMCRVLGGGSGAVRKTRPARSARSPGNKPSTEVTENPSRQMQGDGPYTRYPHPQDEEAVWGAAIGFGHGESTQFLDVLWPDETPGSSEEPHESDSQHLAPLSSISAPSSFAQRRVRKQQYLASSDDATASIPDIHYGPFPGPANTVYPWTQLTAQG
ncbi:hypothetical protein C8R43DRAFT_1128105 [Mycena crocata]|nr:hypothetical protein C8R43DRAFT_1128105 [Mycena crocata]